MNQHFPNNLRFYRCHHQYTQDNMSHFLHISRQAYNHYETGYRTPDLETFRSISSILDIPMECFFFEITTDSYISRQELIAFLNDFYQLPPDKRKLIHDNVRKYLI